MKNRLAVVIGHSEKSRGTFGISPLDKYEWEYNRDVAKIVYRVAREQNLECEVFERKGYLPDKEEITEVYKRVNEWCSDTNAVCVELHFNSGDSGKYHGSLTLFDEDPSDGLEFARTMHDEMLMVFKRRIDNKHDNRGFHKAGEGYNRGVKNLEAAKVTACILEPGFGDNKKDAELLNKYMIEYAYAIVKGASDFLKQRHLSRQINLV